MARLVRYGSRQKGQATSEYIIIAVLVAVASIAVIMLFGNQIRALFGASTKTMAGQNTSLDTTAAQGADSAVHKDFNTAFQGSGSTGGGGGTTP
ncbi:MAG TPA: hypothetical protein PL033_13895 [Candidatus Brocadiia bacterium]|nr:hypothetical protein [Candidatus Brocadiia bacterium]